MATEVQKEESNTGQRPIVLVAIEPRSYNEAIGTVIGMLRPGLAVEVVEPDNLGAEVARHDPDLVLCSHPYPFAGGGPRWVEYYPYDELAPVRVDGRREELTEVDLEDLLAIIDRAVF